MDIRLLYLSLNTNPVSSLLILQKYRVYRLTKDTFFGLTLQILYGDKLCRDWKDVSSIRPSNIQQYVNFKIFYESNQVYAFMYPNVSVFFLPFCPPLF